MSVTSTVLHHSRGQHQHTRPLPPRRVRRDRCITLRMCARTEGPLARHARACPAGSHTRSDSGVRRIDNHGGWFTPDSSAPPFDWYGGVNLERGATPGGKSVILKTRLSGKPPFGGYMDRRGGHGECNSCRGGQEIQSARPSRETARRES